MRLLRRVPQQHPLRPISDSPRPRCVAQERERLDLGPAASRPWRIAWAAEAEVKRARTEARKTALKKADGDDGTRKALIDDVVATAKARKAIPPGDQEPP